ncbi:recombinase family protein [Bradyrhizobium pachyrhizi]|uniref:recombinase family protein n=1 Tax=Bradyrhizobium pachyrhizi TaxID=280333 RepID=UPI000A4126B7|nr:recombinase family protein [Bradyrhizobium pachyrhizi]
MADDLALNGPVGSSIRAAQYLRMSSENQRYSTDNQQNAISEYAQEHGYIVVASYVDPGKSGLSLKGRDALKHLLSDVLSTNRNFDAVLVLDVSRWGRFQDPDQAAHYEFLCKQAGVRVIYCAEPFGDDAAPITTIVKHLKRVMAAEWSRELSAKLTRAHLQQARLGFRQGGALIYGFRRLLVDAERNRRLVLDRGERKALSSDKTVVIPGPPNELAVIRRIFRLYVQHRLSRCGIVKRLAEDGVKGYGDNPLGITTINHILRSELCVGQMTYNLTTRKMQACVQANPEHLWIRFSAFSPIVPASQFQKAQLRLAQQASRRWDKETVGRSLRDVLAKAGKLSHQLLQDTKGAPSPDTVAHYFGSLSAAYAEIGYEPPARRLFGMNAKHWSKREITAGLRELHSRQGRITNRLIDCWSGLPSHAYIRRHFGSVADVAKEAGLPVLSHSQMQKLTWKKRKAAGCSRYYRGVRWTDADLLRALRRLHKSHGYVSQDLLDYADGVPSAYYYAKRFGSLAKAKNLANLPSLSRSEVILAARRRRKEHGGCIRQPKERPGLRYLSNDILVGLKRLAQRKGVVSARLIDEDADLPSYSTVVTHFGSLSAAYKLVGLIRLRAKPARYGLPPGT